MDAAEAIPQLVRVELRVFIQHDAGVLQTVLNLLRPARRLAVARVHVVQAGAQVVLVRHLGGVLRPHLAGHPLELLLEHSRPHPHLRDNRAHDCVHEQRLRGRLGGPLRGVKDHPKQVRRHRGLVQAVLALDHLLRPRGEGYARQQPRQPVLERLAHASDVLGHRVVAALLQRQDVGGVVEADRGDARVVARGPLEELHDIVLRHGHVDVRAGEHGLRLAQVIEVYLKLLVAPDDVVVDALLVDPAAEEHLVHHLHQVLEHE